MAAPHRRSLAEDLTLHVTMVPWVASDTSKVEKHDTDCEALIILSVILVHRQQPPSGPKIWKGSIYRGPNFPLIPNL